MTIWVAYFVSLGSACVVDFLSPTLTPSRLTRWVTKKTRILSMKFWLFNRDSYNGLWNNPNITLASRFFFIAQIFQCFFSFFFFFSGDRWCVGMVTPFLGGSARLVGLLWCKQQKESKGQERVEDEQFWTGEESVPSFFGGGGGLFYFLPRWINTKSPFPNDFLLFQCIKINVVCTRSLEMRMFRWTSIFLYISSENDPGCFMGFVGDGLLTLRSCM